MGNKVKGLNGGHKPNNAAKRNRKRYNDEGRYEQNKARKARKEAKKAARLAKRRA